MYEFTFVCRDFRTHSCFHCATEAAREVSKLATWCGFAPALVSLCRYSLPSRTCRAIRFNLKSFNQCVQAALNQNVRPSPISRVRQTFPPPPSPPPILLSPPPPPLCIGTLLCYVSPISCTPHLFSTLQLHIPALRAMN